jgi:hypothetical protein
LRYQHAKSAKGFYLRRVGPTHTYTNDVRCATSIGTISAEFLHQYQSQSPVPVFRAYYYCLQKCLYPEEEEKYVEVMQKDAPGQRKGRLAQASSLDLDEEDSEISNKVSEGQLLFDSYKLIELICELSFIRICKLGREPISGKKTLNVRLPFRWVVLRMQPTDTDC